MDPADESFNTINQYHDFVKAFLAKYKESPVLWNLNHPNYRNKTERAEAYEKLVITCKEYFPEADEDFVRTKINTFRTTFRKEYKKVISSKQKSNNPNDIYKPNLWYFNLLLFITGEECGDISDDENEKKQEVASFQNPVHWNKKCVVCLIKLYKQYPCLYYSTSTENALDSSIKQRKNALFLISKKLTKITGAHFTYDSVRKKLSQLRSQFVREYKRTQYGINIGHPYESKWWGFKMMEFLSPYVAFKNGKPSELCVIKTDSEQTSSPILSHSPSPILPENCNGYNDNSITKVKEREEVQIDEESRKESPVLNSDIFDAIARNAAHQLRQMTEQQFVIAEKILKEVLYRGQMEELNSDSRLILS